MDIQKTIFLSVQAWAQNTMTPQDKLFEEYMEYIERRSSRTGKDKRKHIVEIALNYPQEVRWVCEDDKLWSAIQRGRKHSGTETRLAVRQMKTNARHIKKIERAITLLEENGYKVTKWQA